MQSMWEKLALTIGSSDLIKDPRFLTNSDRLNHQDDLDKPISKFIKKYNREEVLNIFSKEGITVGPVLDISEIIEHPYIQDREVLIDHFNKEYGNVLMHQAFPRLSKTPGKIRHPAPSLGGDTDLVLKEIGISEKQIQMLRKNKIIN